MYKLNDLRSVIEDYAPLSLSYKMIERGDYDNSGVIVESTDSANKILFSLDLSLESVKKAQELKCDTIVTHHPAIYAPIKNLSVNGETKPLLEAIKSGMNVLSMHLNLDMASKGIDACLVEGLGGENVKILDVIDDGFGYGREAFVKECSLKEFADKVANNFNTDKIIAYGKGNVKKIASFCGGGASHALKEVVSGATDADTVVTSDMAHHVLKELVEKDKNVVIIPHYVSEEYGFNKFYLHVKDAIKGKAEVYYFVDKRFI